MNNPDNHPAAAAEQLRQGAEAILAREEAAAPPPPAQETHRIASQELVRKVVRQPLHELRVQQIQLEMQNEELRRMQAELDAARARYFDLYDQAPVGYCTVSEAGLILEANLTVATLLGVTRSELVKHPLARFILPADQDIHYLRCRQLFATRSAQTYEARLLRRDGTAFWAHLTATAASEETGVTVCRLALSDITERKRTEAIMAARLRLMTFAQTHTLTELLRATLDEAEAITGSSIGFYHFLQADQKTLWLQAWSTNTVKKMCTAEGAGQHYPVDKAGVWVDCIHQRQPVIHNDYANLRHRKGLPPGHAPVLRQLVVPVMRGSQIAAILGVGNKPANYTDEDTKAVSALADLAWDIAENKRAEEALRASEDRYRRIVETAEEGIWMVDAEWKTTFANARMERLLGCAPGAMQGRPIFDFMDEEGRQIASKLAQRRERGINEEHDFKFIRRDGAALWAIVSTNSFTNAAGAFSGALAMVTDITERKHAADALCQRNQEIAAFNEAMVGRELRMIDLKAEINELCRRAGEAERYEVEEGMNVEGGRTKSEGGGGGGKSETRNPKSE